MMFILGSMWALLGSCFLMGVFIPQEELLKQNNPFINAVHNSGIHLSTLFRRHERDYAGLLRRP